MVKEKKVVTLTEKKSMLTTFLLLFPSLMISMIATVKQSFLMIVITIALFGYQAILLKNFVSEQYKFE